jgi:hypothetical protein
MIKKVKIQNNICLPLIKTQKPAKAGFVLP